MPTKLWEKGQSGNPSGKPKGTSFTTEIARAAREKTQQAIDCLTYWCNQRKNGRAAVMAANALLDRGWGKPAQDVKFQGEVSHFVMSSEPLTDNQWNELYGKSANGNGHMGTPEGTTKITH